MRISKPETNSKTEIRIARRPNSAFEVRISNLLRISIFEFRIQEHTMSETSRSRRPPPASTQIVQTWRDDNTCRFISSTYVESKFAKRTIFFANSPSFKVGTPSRHSLALRAHRHRLSAVARKKMYALARREIFKTKTQQQAADTAPVPAGSSAAVPRGSGPYR